MPDREKVIKEFEKICGYTLRPHEFRVMNDVLVLLKEQEPVEPVDIGYFTSVPYPFRCGNCDTHIKKGQRFCDYCGRPVKWNA